MKKQFWKSLLVWALLLCLIFSGCAANAPDSLQSTQPAITEPDGFVTLPVEDDNYATEADGSQVTIPQWDPDEEQPDDRDEPDRPEWPDQPEQTDPPETQAPAVVPNSSGFQVRFLDVGQADAALIICDGKTLLIDGGNSADSNLIYSVLKNRGVTHLDYIIATHAHEDHVGGLSGALNYASVGKVYSPVTSYDSSAFRKFISNVDKQGKSVTIPQVGTQFALGSAVCSVLAVNTTSDTNNTSIVVRIVYGNTSFLFTGDAEREVEQAMISRGAYLYSTVLKVGHHGSSTSTSYQFLWNVMPQYAVISCGKGNSYGHPHEEVLSRLYDADVTLFRTDLQGDIVCTSNGSSVKFSVSRNPNADVYNGRGSNPSLPEQTDPPENLPQQTQPEDTPTGADYVLNTNSMKFHYAYCEWAQKISDRNRLDYTGSREDLIAQGYTPCGGCNP